MRWLVTGLAGLLAAAFVALAGAGGWLYWNRVEIRAEQAARAELAPLAKQQIPVVFTYVDDLIAWTVRQVRKRRGAAPLASGMAPQPVLDAAAPEA